MLGQIELVDFSDSAVLVKHGNNYFRNADPKIKAQPVVGTEVQQGRIENSNVSTADSAVRLVSVMRQFEMLQKAVTLAGEMDRKSVEEVARVNS